MSDSEESVVIEITITRKALKTGNYHEAVKKQSVTTSKTFDDKESFLAEMIFFLLKQKGTI